MVDGGRGLSMGHNNSGPDRGVNRERELLLALPKSGDRLWLLANNFARLYPCCGEAVKNLIVEILSLWIGPGPFAFDENTPQNFSGRRFGNLVDKLDKPNPLERRDPVADEFENIFNLRGRP